VPTRPIAQPFTAFTSTSTGNMTGRADFGTGMQAASVYHNLSGTTKNVVFKMQGSVSNSSIWTDLMATTTGSTAGTGHYASTATATFDKVRLNVTANTMDSTDSGTLTAWVIARP